MAWTPVFTDPFTGTQYTALPTYNAAWANGSNVPGWRISTNGTSAACGVTSNVSRAYLVSAPMADQACEFTMNGSNLHLEQGLLLRFTEDNDAATWGAVGYLAYVVTAGGTAIERLDGGGSHTQIASGAYTAVTADVFRFEVIGSGLNVLVNGVSKATVTDATLTTGSVGMWGDLVSDDSTNMSVDNFTAYQQSVAAGGAIVFNRMIG